MLAPAPAWMPAGRGVRLGLGLVFVVVLPLAATREAALTLPRGESRRSR